MCLSRLAQIVYAVVCFFAVCCILSSTFTDEWTVVKSIKGDKVDAKMSFGLLSLKCQSTDCEGVKNDAEKTNGWQKAVLACMLLALIVAIVAFIWDCITFCACCCRDCLLQPLPGLASLCALLLSIAVTIYGIKHKEVVNDHVDLDNFADGKHEVDIVFGYSFYIAIVAIILSLINIVVGSLGVCCAENCEPI